MPMPTDLGIVDLMIGFPAENARRHYDFMKANLRDAESGEMEFPAEYMFKEVPNHKEPEEDAVAITLGEMDRFGIEIGLVGMGAELTRRAVADHPDRFALSLEVDPNRITDAVRRIRPWAVDVSSGVESAKGIKDADMIAAFIAGVRHADG